MSTTIMNKGVVVVVAVALTLLLASSIMIVSAFTIPTTPINRLTNPTGRRALSSSTFASSSGSTSTSSFSSSALSSSTNRSTNGSTNGNENGNTKTKTKEQKYQELIGSSKLSLAPMMEYTDRHFRKLISLVSTKTLCYTEMVAANALVHERKGSKQAVLDGNHLYDDDPYRNKQHTQLDIDQYGYDMTYIRRFLEQYPPTSTSTTTSINKKHNPTVLQLGGSDPDMLQEATSIVAEVTNRGYCDYTAINLNCGCPSPKVAGKGNFGASLMNDPYLVRDITSAMDKGMGGTTPITVKCRIGTDETLTKQTGLTFTSTNYQQINEEEEYKQLVNFINIVASDGIVTDFQIHARIAVLKKNFSPNDNRKIPILKYKYIYRLIEEFPELHFSLNGGVDSLVQVKEELDGCPNLNGVMVGRALAANPWSFAMVDDLLYDDDTNDDLTSVNHHNNNNRSKPKNRLEVLQEYGKYADQEEQNWDPVKIRRFIIKAITPLFAGEPSGKRYRIALDEIAGLPKKHAIAIKKSGGSGGVVVGDSRMNTPISELIMNAALDTLSEDVLLRTPEESYERILAASNKNRSYSNNSNLLDPSTSTSTSQPRSQIIKDWQDARKEEEAGV